MLLAVYFAEFLHTILDNNSKPTLLNTFLSFSICIHHFTTFFMHIEEILSILNESGINDNFIATRLLPYRIALMLKVPSFAVSVATICSKNYK